MSDLKNINSAKTFTWQRVKVFPERRTDCFLKKSPRGDVIKNEWRKQAEENFLIPAKWTAPTRIVERSQQKAQAAS